MATRRFAAEGSPADCVLAGLYDVMKDNRPDLVLSGVNRGNNSAENTLYSGTIGGAMEAALQGLPAIALSQFYGPGQQRAGRSVRGRRRAMAPRPCARILDARPVGRRGLPAVLQRQLPARCRALDVKGIKVAAQGFRRDTLFGVEPHLSPSGRKFLWIKGGPQHMPTGPGTDAAANLDGYISVTPMRADLTAHDAAGRSLKDAARMTERRRTQDAVPLCAALARA